MENHFRPYTIRKNSPLGLSLDLRSKRKWTPIITWRILPLIILACLVLAIQYLTSFPWYFIVGLIGVGLMALYMFSVKIIWRINITSSYLDIVSLGLFGLSETKYFFSQVKQIDVTVSDSARGGVILYQLTFKNDKPVVFLRQPTLMATTEDLQFVSKLLNGLTNLDVKTSGDFKSRP